MLALLTCAFSFIISQIVLKILLLPKSVTP